MRSLAIWIIIAAALILFPFYASIYATSLLIAILMYIALAQSWSIFSGYTRYISIGSAGFFGIGAYTAAVLSSKIPLPIVIVIAALVTFIIATPMGLITLRLKGPYFAILTFGLGELLGHIFLWWEMKITGTRGRIMMPVEKEMIYYAILGIAAIVFLTAYLVKVSKFGLALQGIGQDEEKAETLGVNTTFFKVTAFALSASLMGAVGSAITPRWTYLDPYIAFNPLISFQPIMMALIGGVGSLYGPVLGAVFLGLLSEVLLTRIPYYYMIMLGVILITVILFFPGGLIGLIGKKQFLYRLSQRPRPRTPPEC
jgi:branched-chain amino acid transport system permease protein